MPVSREKKKTNKNKVSPRGVVQSVTASRQTSWGDGELWQFGSLAERCTGATRRKCVFSFGSIRVFFHIVSIRSLCIFALPRKKYPFENSSLGSNATPSYRREQVVATESFQSLKTVSEMLRVSRV